MGDGVDGEGRLRELYRHRHRVLHLRDGRGACPRGAFFPEFSETAGTLAAFAMFAVVFFARPVGGVVFGHFGDRVGRKVMLIFSLLLTGVATFLIGVLPGYAAIGIWAPVLLVALRFLQGWRPSTQPWPGDVSTPAYPRWGRRSGSCSTAP